MSEHSTDRIAEQGARAAELIRNRGPEATRLAKDWATPLRSSSGPGPKNGVSDPTGEAATPERVDRTSSALPLLKAKLDAYWRASNEVTAVILWLSTDAKIENQRAGVGSCESCNRYCDGSVDALRLRAGLCNACRMRQARAS